MRGSAERAGPLAIFDSHCKSSFRGGPKDRTRNLEIPGSMLAHRPGMTSNYQTHSATIFSSNAISASGAVTFGEWLASISK
jgi:hypothetical protein